MLHPQSQASRDRLNVLDHTETAAVAKKIDALMPAFLSDSRTLRSQPQRINHGQQKHIQANCRQPELPRGKFVLRNLKVSHRSHLNF